jgi:hypothetical protein
VGPVGEENGRRRRKGMELSELELKEREDIVAGVENKGVNQYITNNFESSTARCS